MNVCSTHGISVGRQFNWLLAVTGQMPITDTYIPATFLCVGSAIDIKLTSFH